MQFLVLLTLRSIDILLLGFAFHRIAKAVELILQAPLAFLELEHLLLLLFELLEIAFDVLFQFVQLRLLVLLAICFHFFVFKVVARPKLRLLILQL